jgi:hypothetical protein
MEFWSLVGAIVLGILLVPVVIVIGYFAICLAIFVFLELVSYVRSFNAEYVEWLKKHER